MKTEVPKPETCAPQLGVRVKQTPDLSSYYWQMENIFENY